MKKTTASFNIKFERKKKVDLITMELGLKIGRAVKWTELMNVLVDHFSEEAAKFIEQDEKRKEEEKKLQEEERKRQEEERIIEEERKQQEEIAQDGSCS